jgi:hypothetical protein
VCEKSHPTCAERVENESKLGKIIIGRMQITRSETIVNRNTAFHHRMVSSASLNSFSGDKCIFGIVRRLTINIHHHLHSLLFLDDKILLLLLWNGCEVIDVDDE